MGHGNYRCFFLLLVYGTLALWHAVGLLVAHGWHVLRSLSADRVLRCVPMVGLDAPTSRPSLITGLQRRLQSPRAGGLMVISPVPVPHPEPAPLGASLKPAAPRSGGTLFWRWAELRSARCACAQCVLPIRPQVFCLHVAAACTPHSAWPRQAGDPPSSLERLCAYPQVLALLLAAPAAVALSSLLSFHLKMVATNKTTIEWREGVTAQLAAPVAPAARPRGDHPYDIGERQGSAARASAFDQPVELQLQAKHLNTLSQCLYTPRAKPPTPGVCNNLREIMGDADEWCWPPLRPTPGGTSFKTVFDPDVRLPSYMLRR